MRLLLISNSTRSGEAFLDYPKKYIKEFLGSVDEVLFVPYAAVVFSYDDYLSRVQARFAELGIRVKSVHRESHPAKAVRSAQAIVVGGGNTFALLRTMQQQGLIEAIRERVSAEIPYVGWSAGSNVACPTICTTNDMPIVEPASFHAINVIPFQINPHYLDTHPEGHNGETREERILEYIEANRNVYVAGLREGSMFRVNNFQLDLIGDHPVRIFHYGNDPVEINPGGDLSFLMR